MLTLRGNFLDWKPARVKEVSAKEKQGPKP